MHAALAEVLKHPAIWRGDGLYRANTEAIDCFHPELAAILPGGGWPKAAVTELLTHRPGCGELRLLLPALARLTQSGQRVLLISPPHIPYPPAWQSAGVDMRYLTWISASTPSDTLWASEQALREPACGAVVSWLKQPLGDQPARRLQLAAEKGGGCGFVLREAHGSIYPSPLALRLSVAAVAGGVTIHVLKRRGAPHHHPVFLPHISPARYPAYGQSHHAVASFTPTRSAARSTEPRPHVG
ncbi:translesion DNA synthesis-associated protein ImuA [Chitinimonas sp. BJB300]|uniref:translesion DNA synthesis-associated protein ImuA n=1 Tax=Chitinimonas sp. BJB300 TaxID=1559339 RepID=UPI000C100C73|nr:translesion DNA synthesis-associated protein ImuA [Chitinimonas sp. BJB300]PHV10432.1 SOS cell division inhibitor SulA [Chitinimonas sp. BJB300]TSJ83269.1 translesion DNA synthesis-associated protein ImuA [Chitinimonas sp. BJB300]